MTKKLYLIIVILIILACGGLPPTMTKATTATPIIETPPFGFTGVVMAETLNIRQSPTENSTAIGELHAGDKVIYFNCVRFYDDDMNLAQEWLQLDHGWIAGYYLGRQYVAFSVC